MLTLSKNKVQGIYKVAIAKVEEGEAKNDKKTPFVQFTLTIVEAPKPSEIGNTIPFMKFYHKTEFGMKQLISFIETATGQELPEGDMEIDENDLLQAIVTVQVEPEKFGDTVSTKLKNWWPAEEYDKQVGAYSTPF